MKEDKGYGTVAFSSHKTTLEYGRTCTMSEISLSWARCATFEAEEGSSSKTTFVEEKLVFEKPGFLSYSMCC